MPKLLEVHEGALTASSIDPVAAEFAEDLKDVLARLAALPGVSLAMLVDREGFLIESAGDTPCAAEMAGALATCLAESSDSVGRELGHGALQSVVLEYDTGAILVNSAGPTTILATMLRDTAALPRVRHDVKKTLPELVNAI